MHTTMHSGRHISEHAAYWSFEKLDQRVEAFATNRRTEKMLKLSAINNANELFIDFEFGLESLFDTWPISKPPSVLLFWPAGTNSYPSTSRVRPKHPPQAQLVQAGMSAAHGDLPVHSKQERAEDRRPNGRC